MKTKKRDIRITDVHAEGIPAVWKAHVWEADEHGDRIETLGVIVGLTEEAVRERAELVAKVLGARRVDR